MMPIKHHIGVHHLTGAKRLLAISAIVFGGVLGVFYSAVAYPEIFRTEIKLEKDSNIGPNEPIVVYFSAPVFGGGYGSNIRINKINNGQANNLPSNYFNVRLEDSNKKLVVSPENFWEPETDYLITLPEGRNAMLGEIKETQFKFSVIAYPKVKSVSPSDKAKNVALEIEDPITVNFAQSAREFAIKITLTPESEVTYWSDPEKTQYKILPKEKIKDGTEYTVKVYARYKGDTDKNYREIFSSAFETVPPPPKDWNKDFTLRLEQAKKYTRPAITSGKYIDINLTSQILSLFEDGKLLDSSMISTGKRGMDTPKGTFKILEKRPRPWSHHYALYMPWFMLFTRAGHGIHELPEWPGGYKEGANHLGTPVSHGCVRLGVGPAKRAYDWTDIGTPVVVY